MVDSSANYKLYAKTGWTARKEKQIGWYVGFIIRNNNTWLFAMNINIINNKDSNFRSGITKEILTLEGLIN